MDETLPAAADSWVPEACTLPTVEQPLRLGEFDELFATAVQSVHRTGQHGVRLQLQPDAPVAATTADLMTREAGCCSFFTFTLTATGEQLALDVAVPAGHAELLDALAQRAATAAGPLRPG